MLHLPPLMLLGDDNGDWKRYIDRVYARFREDLIDSPPVCGRKRWALKRYPLIDGREATFWHLSSEGNQESERLPDLRRMERIGWIKPIVAAAGSDDVLCWEQQRDGERRVAVGLPDLSYVVIVADRGSYVLPWTAYQVTHAHRIEKLRRDWLGKRLASPWR